MNSDWNRGSLIKNRVIPKAHKMAEERLLEEKARKKLLLPENVYLQQQEQLIVHTIEEQFIHLEEQFSLVKTMIQDYGYLLPIDRKENLQKEIEIIFSDNIYARIHSFKEENKIQSLKEMLGLSDDIVFWVYQVGRSCLEKQKHKEGESIFSLLTALDNFVVDYWLGLGISQKNLGKKKEAIHSFSLASQIDPEQPVSRYHAAEIFYHLGEIQEAKSELEQLSRIVEKTQEKTWISLMNALESRIQNKEPEYGD